MAIIQSGVSLPTLWEIDAGSNAGRVTLYDSNGNELAGVGVLESLNNILDSLNENVTLNLSVTCKLIASLRVSFPALV